MRGLIIAVMALVVACSQPPSGPRSLEQRIDALFSAYDVGDRPGYAIGVIRGGDLWFARGYGLADLERQRPITPDTSFNLASLSKQFTGAAVALAINNGRLGLDDRLAEHWPGLPEFMHEITVAHLVYMTSGLTEYYRLPSPKGSWDSEAQFTVDDAIQAVFDSGQLRFQPGSRWSYSNIDYQLLAVQTGIRADTSFADHMQQAVFEPLEMTNSWIDAPIDSDRPSRATSYIWDDQESDGWRIAPRLSPHYGGSGGFSSLTDLAKWDAALYREDTLATGFGALMLSTRRFDHDKENDAFGLVHGSYQGLDTVWYEGGDYGVSTYMVRLPALDSTVICLANFGNAGCGAKARAVIDLLIAYGDDAES